MAPAETTPRAAGPATALRAATLCCWAAAAGAALAQEPAGAPAPAGPGAAVESAAVAARFPEPAVAYRTPAFEPGRSAWTSNAELHALLHMLVRDGESAAGIVKLLSLGSSQTGVPIEALLFTRDAGSTATPPRATRPTVLLIGQQHGDEPAGAEALIVIAQELAAGKLQPLLERINVVVLPRANPDGAALDRRASASGIDINRDHLLLRTPEAQALAQLVREFRPLVVADLHEHAAIAHYVEKFGAVQRADALLQHALTPNLPELVTKAADEWFRLPLQQGLRREGLSSDWYHTTSDDLNDRRLAMGGVQADNGRNVNGLRNAVSLLIDTRGADLGRTHAGRRVHSQVVAATVVLNSAAARAADLARLRSYVDQELSAKACRGEIVVDAATTPSEYTLVMLDPLTGLDKPVTVAWDSALELKPLKRRARPCGYWLGAGEIDAVLRLRGLGVQVQRLEQAGALRAETYAEISRETAARPDGRTSIADGAVVPRIKVELVASLIDVNAGSYYVGLDQPLANLALAALEPDTAGSYLSHRVITALQGLARVLQRPEVKMSLVP